MNLIKVICFNEEIGIIRLDEAKDQIHFQYNEDYLNSGRYENLFPVTKIIRRSKLIQKSFGKYNQEVFRGLPPQIADSLPDSFGNLIFKKWLDHRKKKRINVLEQLMYVADRGMGALEYRPSNNLPKNKS